MMMRHLLPWLLSLVALCASGQVVITLGLMGSAGGALDDTNLIVRYYIDETDDADCAGATASTINDNSTNAYHLDTVGYGSSTMSFTDTSGNCSLESTDSGGDHHAYKSISNSSDVIRDLEGTSTGIQAATIELVVDVDACSGSNGRIFVINATTEDPALGLTCASLTDFRVFWEEAQVEGFTSNSGARVVYHIVIDTTQATAADRIKVYLDGTVQSDSGTPMAQNDRLVFGSNHELLMLNRGVGTWGRSIDGQLFYAAIYDAAFSASRVSDHYDVLTADDDAP